MSELARKINENNEALLDLCRKLANRIDVQEKSIVRLAEQNVQITISMNSMMDRFIEHLKLDKEAKASEKRR